VAMSRLDEPGFVESKRHAEDELSADGSDSEKAANDALPPALEEIKESPPGLGTLTIESFVAASDPSEGIASLRCT